jgi:hypothetical protein
LAIDSNIEDKYKGLLVGLNKDWDNISRSNSKIIETNVSTELTNGQKDYIDLLARKYSDFNVLQSKYFAALLKERVDGLSSTPILSVNKDWQELTDKCNFNFDPDKFPIQTEEKPEFPQEKHVLDHLRKWMGNISGPQQSAGTSASSGGANSQAKGAAAQEKKEEKKEVNI